LFRQKILAINKHFSRSPGDIPKRSFGQDGRHSYITKLGKIEAIKSFIATNDFHFINNGTVIIERTGGANCLFKFNANAQVFSLHGTPGHAFNTSVPKEFNKNDNAEYNIYFQLKLFVTSFDNFSTDEGRFGSFYVTAF
jgi:hypothetical protein